MLRVSSFGKGASIFAGLAVLVLGAANSSAALIEGWNGSTDSWTGFGGPALTTNSTTGVTEGTSALELPDPSSINGGFQSVGSTTNVVFLKSVAAAGGNFSVDVDTPAGEFSGFLQMFYNGNGGLGFSQLNSNALVPGEKTYTFTLSASQITAINAAAAGSSAQLGFDIGNLNSTPTQVDNFQANPLPEPASIGLLAIGGMMAMRRRRA